MKTIHKVLVVVISLLVIVFGIFIYIYYSNNNKLEVTEVKQPVSVDVIKDYNYNLEDRDTDVYKSKYKELKNLLNEKEIDYEKYASVLTELYIIDLYTIINKNTQYDVGGSEFVLDSARDNYELNVRDTIYKYVEDNSNGKRVQELPEVKSTTIDKVDAKKIKVNDKEYDGYSVSITWDYVKDLGYDTKATVNLIKDKNKVYIVSQDVQTA